eukprot:scaffold95101_cov45-Phaeocystis_antarctica.AAC.1
MTHSSSKLIPSPSVSTVAIIASTSAVQRAELAGVDDTRAVVVGQLEEVLQHLTLLGRHVGGLQGEHRRDRDLHRGARLLVGPRRQQHHLLDGLLEACAQPHRLRLLRLSHDTLLRAPVLVLLVADGLRLVVPAQGALLAPGTAAHCVLDCGGRILVGHAQL